MIGTFYNQVDPTNALTIEIHAGDALERYQFNCFQVELATCYRPGRTLSVEEVVESRRVIFSFFFFCS